MDPIKHMAMNYGNVVNQMWFLFKVVNFIANSSPLITHKPNEIINRNFVSVCKLYYFF